MVLVLGAGGGRLLLGVLAEGLQEGEAGVVDSAPAGRSQVFNKLIPRLNATSLEGRFRSGSAHPSVQ